MEEHEADYTSGNVTAKDVVHAGVKTNRLPEYALQDRAYVNAVNDVLRTFSNH